MLADAPVYDASRRRRLGALREATAADPPPDLAARIADDLAIDLTTSYAGFSIPHPFGKASGQLSCTPAQVRADVDAGVAFVVLKTVVGEDPSGHRHMEAWATDESAMGVERVSGARGRAGWTVTWRGRGWSGSLADYAVFFERALAIGAEGGVPIVPSVKLHLPIDVDAPFDREEYAHTLDTLCDVAHRVGASEELAVEKDFSPTLAGDARSVDRDTIVRWLREVPAWMARPGLRVGVKVMNALEDDGFQVSMVRALVESPTPPDFLVLFNRLYDPTRAVAVGGWDLSDRNLRVLDAIRLTDVPLPPISATGNIESGRMMVEYALRGCTSGQVHTFFQVPRSEYTATGGSRSAAALHTLLLHPTEGLVAWLWHLETIGALTPVDGVLRLRDVVPDAQ